MFLPRRLVDSVSGTQSEPSTANFLCECNFLVIGGESVSQQKYQVDLLNVRILSGLNEWK
jgi:hypothetical protein